MNEKSDLESGREGADVSADEAASPTFVRSPSGDATLGLPGPGERGSTHGRAGDLPALQPGEPVAGRFVVLRFIARGGMGAVYEANDVVLHTRVALKVLQGRVTADAAAMERFHREVLLARRVTHPNVCRVYEFYETTTASGVPIHFLTMEYLEGETLAARIARTGRLSTAQALPLVQQMCEGLHAAHAGGVIHRDFKSGNVMLVRGTDDFGQSAPGTTRVAITDFGIARVLEPEGARLPGEGLTGDAGILGTPEYMAPEQVTGGAVSPATDVYALGVVMYEMVTGRLPFSGETPLATAARRINEPPPRPELAAPGLDPRWSSTILRCLERDPKQRFHEARQVLASLSGSGQRRRWLFPLAGCAVLLLALAAGIGLLRRPANAPAKEAAAAAPPSIAVLAFVDMSPEHNQEYFSDGLAEEIIGALTQVPGLQVAARSSSFSFKGKNEDLRSVGQKLAVANVLEGSVRKSGSRLRVTAQLVNAASGFELWSQTFDRELADVFAVQDEIARAVVAALKMKVLPALEPTPRQVTSPDAYTHYLRGLELENSGSTAGFAGAVEEYRRTVSLDPNYAPAHARLAWALFFHFDQQAAPAAKAAAAEMTAEAERAVALDPNLAEAYVTRGFLRTALRDDKASGLEDFQRALALSPGSARAHLWLGLHGAVYGKLALAIQEGETALALDPLSPEVRFRLATFYDAAGRHADARQLLKKALEIAPHYGLALRQLAFTELLDGHPAEALAIFQTHEQGWVRDLGAGLANFSLGKQAESQAALDHLIATTPGAQYQIAQIYAWRGEIDQAFTWLERGRLGHDPGLGYLNYDPFLKSLHGDPRWKALLETLHHLPE